MTLAYRVELTPDDNDTLLVTSPDIAGIVTFGETEDDALHHARDAIETMLASMVAHGEVVSPGWDGPCDAPFRLVRVSPSVALKVALHHSLCRSGLTRADLAERADLSRESIDGLFRFDRPTRLEQFEAAFGVLGASVDVVVGRAA